MGTVILAHVILGCAALGMIYLIFRAGRALGWPYVLRGLLVAASSQIVLWAILWAAWTLGVYSAK